MRASDDVSVACCKGVWWVRSITALALMLSAVGLAVLGFIDNATAQALDKQVAKSLRVEWQRTTSLGGRPPSKATSTTTPHFESEVCDSV